MGLDAPTGSVPQIVLWSGHRHSPDQRLPGHCSIRLFRGRCGEERPSQATVEPLIGGKSLSLAAEYN